MLHTIFLFSILFSQQGPTYWPVLQLLNKVLGTGVDIGVCYPISSKQDLGNLRTSEEQVYCKGSLDFYKSIHCFLGNIRRETEIVLLIDYLLSKIRYRRHSPYYSSELYSMQQASWIDFTNRFTIKYIPVVIERKFKPHECKLKWTDPVTELFIDNGLQILLQNKMVCQGSNTETMYTYLTSHSKHKYRVTQI